MWQPSAVNFVVCSLVCTDRSQIVRTLLPGTVDVTPLEVTESVHHNINNPLYHPAYRAIVSTRRGFVLQHDAADGF